MHAMSIDSASRVARSVGRNQCMNVSASSASQAILVSSVETKMSQVSGIFLAISIA